MPNLPLLIFPKPSKGSIPKKKPGFGKIRPPDNKIGQAQRISEKFESIQAQFQLTASGDIEKVLVIETIGKRSDFHKAVRQIDGLEWLAEIDEDEIDIDWDFLYPILAKISEMPKENEKNEKINQEIKKSGGRLYLALSNKQAIDRLMGLWNKWKEGKPLDYGYGAWKPMFEQIHELRFWNHEDMFRESGLLDDLKENIKHGQTVDGKTEAHFEVEMHYRKDEGNKGEAFSSVRNEIENVGGSVEKPLCISEINFHAFKATLPLIALKPFLNQDLSNLKIAFLQPSRVKYCRPMSIVTEVSDDKPTHKIEFNAAPCNDKPPVIALLDGAPILQHDCLKGCIVFDDPDGYLERYDGNKKQEHGTAMASLICHGDLQSTSRSSLPRKIYSRPVITEDNQSKLESFDPSVFPEDITMRAVKRMFEGENDERATAPSVRVIDFSLGNERKVFLHEISPWARVLDYLSWRYKVLFIVSAGNQNNAIFENINKNNISQEVICEINEKQYKWRIIEPAESINALIIGALNKDFRNHTKETDNIDPLQGKLAASLYSRIGNGFRNQIKPDILVSGGKMHYRRSADGNLTPNKAFLYQGLEHAYPDNALPENLNAQKRTWGTSNAAALTSHAAGEIYEMLEDIREESSNPYDEKYSSLLIKALLVHGASRNSMSSIYEDALKNPTNSSRWKRYVSRFIGYGVPDFERVKECTDSRVVSLGYGEIEGGRRHTFRLPIPSQCKQSQDIRLTVTLAWFSPIAPDRQIFRKAKLVFSIGNIDKKDNKERLEYDGQQVKNGTVQHEIFTLKKSSLGEHINIDIDCSPDAAEHLDEPIPYGLAVTLEVAEDISIYNDIKVAITTAIPTP